MKEAHGDGEVVVVSLGPAAALDSLRKALAMGADRAVLVSDDAAAGSDLVATSRVLAARSSARARISSSSASSRPTPTAPSSGRRSPSGCGCRWSRRPAELELADGKATVKRQTEFGYDRIEAPLPGRGRRLGRDQRAALPVAEGDHGREVEAAGHCCRLDDLGLAADLVGETGSKTEVLGAREPAAAAARAARSRTTAPPRSRSSTSSWRRSSSDGDPRLPRAPRRRAPEGCARRARQGRVARRRRGRRRDRRLGRRPRSPPRPGRTARRRSGSRTTRRSRRRCRSRASTCSRQIVRDGGYDTVLFAASVLAADVAAGLAARLDAGLNWDLVDLVAAGRPARRQAAGARRLGLRRRRLEGRAAARARPLGHVRARRDGRRARGRRGRRSSSRTSRPRRRCSSRRTRSRRARRSRTPTSIVAGGRGLGGPENFALVEELAKALGGAVAATRAVVDAGWYPYSTQVGQTGQERLAEALRRLRDLRRDPAQGRACRART